MMRGTFANIRIKNEMVPGVEGGLHQALPSGEQMPIYDAAMQYAKEARAAGGVRRQGVRHRFVARLGGEGHPLLGVKAVIAESFERIHRSNLVGMGVLPLQFSCVSLQPDGQAGKTCCNEHERPHTLRPHSLVSGS
jgi:aconitate hydratase